MAASNGQFLEDDLREILTGVCRRCSSSLVVLTSRFPFADLEPYLGRGFRALDLDHLGAAAGAELLTACGVGGTEEERQQVSRELEGHPLALRVFAGTLAGEADGDPSRLVQRVFRAEGLRENDPLESKLKHLLHFYEQSLPRPRVALMGFVSLFRTPASVARLLPLARGLPGARETLDGFADDAIARELSAMARDHLLIHDRLEDGAEAYSCHPILHDHFRGSLLGWGEGVAASAAGLITGTPSNDRPTDVRQLEPLLIAIELLLDAGEIKAADELYRGRLAGGWIFNWLPAPVEGLRCTLGFTANQQIRERCLGWLSERALAFYVAWVGSFAKNTGEFALGLRSLKQAEAISRKADDKRSLCANLLQQCSLLKLLGDIVKAERIVRQPLALARELQDMILTRDSLCRLADCLATLGRLPDALVVFNGANEIENRLNHTDLYSLRGVLVADLYLRVGRLEHARSLTKANLAICANQRWQEDVALCRWILGRADTADGQYDNAAAHLGAAEATFRGARQVSDLPRVLLARSELEQRWQRWDEAEEALEEALRLAAPRGMRLEHANALVFRARIRVDRARAAGATDQAFRNAGWAARDDAEAAINLVRDCGYAWAELEAVAVLSEACDILGDRDTAARHRREAAALAARLADPGEAPLAELEQGRQTLAKATDDGDFLIALGNILEGSL